MSETKEFIITSIYGRELHRGVGVSLREALESANLRGANLRGYYRVVRDDFFAVLDAAPAEVGGLSLAVASGRVDNSPDAALVAGWIAQWQLARAGAVSP